MKLLTLNCHSWQEENQIGKIRYLAKIIDEKKYEVIALQEVSQLINSKVMYENIREDNFVFLLNEELKRLGNTTYNFYWDVAHIGYECYSEGLCIMTKLPINKKSSFYVSESTDIRYWKTRKLIKTKLDYNGRDIVFYSCHLGWWKDEEEPFIYQANKLIKDIDTNELVFIMGDFNNNAYIRQEGYDYLINNGLIDTYSLANEKDNGITVKGKIAGWDSNSENLRLDIIFTNKNIEIKSSNVIFNGINKDIISDHFGVEVDINI
ncbi:MAG: endonuclease/exonuclease/phosphatase family protein [Peptostreptococcaceae bacterium]